MKRITYRIAFFITLLGLSTSSLLIPQAANAHWYCNAHPHPHPGPGGLACIPRPRPRPGPGPFFGGFVGGMAGSLINGAIQSNRAEKTTVIYQQPPAQVISQPIGTISSTPTMGQQVLQRNGLIGVTCTPGTAVIKLPTTETVCAYPTSNVPAGFYEVHPQTWQVISVSHSY